MPNSTPRTNKLSSIFRGFRKSSPRQGYQYQTVRRGNCDNSAARTTEGIDLSKVVDYRRQVEEAKFRKFYAKKCGIRRRDFESHWNRKKRKLGQEIAHLEMMAAKERRRQSEAETLLEQEEVLHQQLQEKCSDLLMELARAVEPDIEMELLKWQSEIKASDQRLIEMKQISDMAKQNWDRLYDRYELVCKALKERRGWFYREYGKCPF
ncbi:uncharacterized protein LOC142340772 isoform X2 [Convolutriloba macropyga]